LVTAGLRGVAAYLWVRFARLYPLSLLTLFALEPSAALLMFCAARYPMYFRGC
jgi:hypothetical protein